METNDRERTRRAGPGSDRVKSLMDEIENHVRNSKRSLLPGNGYVIDREWIKQILDNLRSELPLELEQAREIVRQQKTILINAKQDADEMVSYAKEEAARVRAETDEYAKRTKADVETHAQIYYDQRVNEGNQILAEYQKKATALLEDADERAVLMVDESTVMRRAEVEAEELRASVYDEMTDLRQKTFAYLDDIIGELDEAVSSVQVELRKLRHNMSIQSRAEIDRR